MAGTSPPGIAVDSKGGAVVDPTKNVLDLVLAAVTRINDVIDLNVRRFNDLVKLHVERQDDLRSSLDRRVTDMGVRLTEINSVRNDYENRIELIKSDFGKQIAGILASQADKSALLLSAQIDKLTNATTERLAVVEKNQYVSSGSTSIRDPATDRMLQEISLALGTLKTTGSKGEGGGEARRELIAWIIAALAAGAAIGELFLHRVSS